LGTVMNMCREWPAGGSRPIKGEREKKTSHRFLWGWLKGFPDISFSEKTGDCEVGGFKEEDTDRGKHNPAEGLGKALRTLGGKENTGGNVGQ